jgi:hypothetical protein
MQALGAFITRTENVRQNCGEASRSEGETTVGSLTLAGPPHLAATCALPTSTTATVVILSSAQDEPQSIRLATCLDRSVAASRAVASMVSPCLPFAQAPLASGAPGAGRAAPASGGASAGASRRTRWSSFGSDRSRRSLRLPQIQGSSRLGSKPDRLLWRLWGASRPLA